MVIGSHTGIHIVEKSLLLFSIFNLNCVPTYKDSLQIPIYAIPPQFPQPPPPYPYPFYQIKLS